MIPKAMERKNIIARKNMRQTMKTKTTRRTGESTMRRKITKETMRI